MDRKFDRRQLVPPGFSVLSLDISESGVKLVMAPVASFGICPCCGSRAVRIQSRYQRHVTDLPLSGRNVDLCVIVRRFWCDAVLCGQRIFCERFDRDILAPWARRTGRLEMIVHHLGLALGGRPAAAFADRLMMPVSNDTLLRVVRRRAHVPAETLNVIGIDDFAWKRNHRYGTIVCDLERRLNRATLAGSRAGNIAGLAHGSPVDPHCGAATGVADMARPQPRRFLMPDKWLIAGI